MLAAQPIGPIGRVDATATIRHFLVSWMLSEFNGDTQASNQLMTISLHPNTIQNFVNDCGSLPTGINTETSSTTASIFPNPATNNITITTELAASEISITNTTGQNVYQKTINKSSLKIDVQNFPKGIYFVNVNNHIKNFKSIYSLYKLILNTKIMKTLFTLSLIIFTGLSFNTFAQTPYTQPIYNYDSIVDIEYGVANNYAGNADTLLMDIYKPIGNSNCLRPIMILAHGGAWVVESKENNSIQNMARELAKRGWVVANINYRLGTNKASNYTSNALCNGLGIEPCVYVADSAEVERANYRAMQDAKGAIRFMKSRNLIDSTDINNVFMAGESAGAFISISAGFTNSIIKKPASCYAIGNATTPDPVLLSLAFIVFRVFIRN